MTNFLKKLFKPKQVDEAPKTVEELAREDELRQVFSKLNEILKAHPLTEWCFWFDGTVRRIEFSLGEYMIRLDGPDDLIGYYHNASLIFFFIKNRETDNYISYIYEDGVCSTVIDREGLALSASLARDSILAERKRKAEESKLESEKLACERRRKLLNEFLSKP